MTTPAYAHDRLRLACEPAYAVLDDLIHRGAPDAATRTMMTTALVLTLWQRCGRRMTPHIPSMITLNAAGANSDPIDQFVKDLIWNEQQDQPGPHGHRNGSAIKPDEAHQIIKIALIEMKRLNRTIAYDRFAQEGARILEKDFYQARMSAFGYGNSRAYTRTWDKQLGLLADQNNEVILRLNSSEDREAFRRDAIKNREKLMLPGGVSLDRLLGVTIAASTSGSLSETMWDEKLVDSIINMGLPIIFLPHIAEDPPKINMGALSLFEYILSAGCDIGVTTSLSVTPNDWYKVHVKDIRSRLHLFPGVGNYEFAILQVLRQLRDVYYAIARYACKSNMATGEQRIALCMDLNAYTLRGIAIGIAAFAWHGIGFDPGCTRQKALKIIKQLRSKGPMTSCEILRSAHLKKEERNLLLERLSAEDLILVEEKTVRATTFAEFVAALHNRPTLPSHFKCSDMIAQAKAKKKQRGKRAKR